MPEKYTELPQKNGSPEDKVPLENAPDEIKLAVDLIMLLEESQIDPQTILAALKIVTHDIEQRQKKCQSLPSGMAQR